jgi:hypothetical protein
LARPWRKMTVLLVIVAVGSPIAAFRINQQRQLAEKNRELTGSTLHRRHELLLSGVCWMAISLASERFSPSTVIRPWIAVALNGVISGAEPAVTWSTICSAILVPSESSLVARGQ